MTIKTQFSTKTDELQAKTLKSQISTFFRLYISLILFPVLFWGVHEQNLNESMWKIINNVYLTTCKYNQHDEIIITGYCFSFQGEKKIPFRSAILKIPRIWSICYYYFRTRLKVKQSFSRCLKSNHYKILCW